MKRKIYLNCGYEDNCKKKDCLKCNSRKRYNLSLTRAEVNVIEDFAVCDLRSLSEEDLDLMQKIMMKIMRKVFREQKK